MSKKLDLRTQIVFLIGLVTGLVVANLEIILTLVFVRSKP